MMPSSAQGPAQESGSSRKPVSITPGLAAKLRKAARGRPPTDALLLQSERIEPWDAGARRRPIERCRCACWAERHHGFTACGTASIIRQLLAKRADARGGGSITTSSVKCWNGLTARSFRDHADTVTRRALIDTSPGAAADKVIPLPTLSDGERAMAAQPNQLTPLLSRRIGCGSKPHTCSV